MSKVAGAYQLIDKTGNDKGSSAGTLITIGAHPDDASIFWGGTIAKCVAEKWRVISIILDQGAGAAVSEPISTEELIKRRADELKRESERLGVAELIHLALPGLREPSLQAEAQQRLIQQLGDTLPRRIITHNVGDSHRTHATCALITFRAIASVRERNSDWIPEIWMSDGWEPVQAADVLIDITAFFNTKMAAIAQHASQLYDSGYLLGAMGLNLYRASFADNHYLTDPRPVFVEAFRSLSINELSGLQQ